MENYIIVYDIMDDRRRYRIFKKLKEFASPVQYSVFEARLNQNDIIKLKYQLEALINKKEDSLIIYKQCIRCKDNTKRMGKQRYIYGEDDILI